MPRMTLQPRDIDILESLGTGRMLTAHDIEWLHYPQWRNHYRSYLERSKQEPQLVYRPRPRVYERMARLRACDLVATIARHVDRKVAYNYRQYEQIPAVYCLTPAGGELLLEQRGSALSSIWIYHQRSGRSVQNTDHTALIGHCYAALRAEAHYRKQDFRDWVGDYVLRASDPISGPNYDWIQLPGIAAPISLIPDGVCRLNGELLFFEIDRSTHSMATWVDKLRAYDTYQGSQLLRQRYQAEHFQVLIVTPDQRRLERIAGEIARTSRQYRHRYRLIETRLLHPTTIRRGWRMVEQASFVPRLIGRRLVETVAQVTLEQAALWGEP